ncbi:NAD(P)/FAD-dependent oxidoreductase [Kribbella sp. NPDC023855]|uniref:NAD(P)/FAD-dependent oxidoreductase n=1 Tax=Kribbella sp. NPDC023855 TaxID=3154698 RepID=UPI0033C9E99F
MSRYDVVVVGAGAAGLSGALALVRSRRSVLVIDDGRPRNAPAGHVHNFLTRDGAPPSEINAIGRAEVAGYGGQFATGTVTAIRRDEVFTVELADGTAYQARRILVTSGLTDVLPEVSGLAERWGKDVLHCPYCHGWEVRDQAIGVLAISPLASHQAQLFRQLSDDVTLFLHTAPELTAEQREELTARQIAVVQGRVEQVEIRDGKLTGVRLENGKFLPLEVLAVQPILRAKATFLTELGLEVSAQEVRGVGYGDALAVDVQGQTAVPGVFAAGNVTDPMAQVVHAAGAGLQAGAAINGDLIAEDTRSALASRGS